MKRLLRYLLAALLAAGCLCSCGRDGKVIPRKKFAKIYAEMFLADAWLTTAPSEARMKADTTSFYEPVFEKYGYTVEDYIASVSYYLQDPDRFSRILKRTGLILDADLAALQAQLEAESVVSVTEEETPADTIAKPSRERRIPRTRQNTIKTDTDEATEELSR